MSLQANAHTPTTNTKDSNLMAAQSLLTHSRSSVQSLWSSDDLLPLLDFDPEVGGSPFLPSTSHNHLNFCSKFVSLLPPRVLLLCQPLLCAADVPSALARSVSGTPTRM